MSDVLVPVRAHHQGELALQPFAPEHAAVVAGWCQSDLELHWLAPSTPPPLTAAKVAAWKQPHGQPYMLVYGPEDAPVAYGELNPMQKDMQHFWLGHLIVCPAQRRRGIGKALVEQLIKHAFLRWRANRVSLVVFPDNESAIACYRRCGMAFRGREHHQFNHRGPRYCLNRFEITAGDYALAHTPIRAV